MLTQVKGILVSTMKITQLRVICDNVDILDWYVYRCCCCCYGCTRHTQYHSVCGFAIDTNTVRIFWHFCNQMLEIVKQPLFYRFFFQALLFPATDICAAYLSFSRQNNSVVLRYDDISGIYFFVYFTISFSCWRMRHMLFLSKSTTFTMERVHRLFFRTKTISGGSLSLLYQRQQPFSFYHIICSSLNLFFFFQSEKV